MKKLVIGIVGVMVLAFAAQSQAVGTGTLDKTSNWYPAGSTLTVNATPGLNSEFDVWSGDISGATINGAEIIIQVTAPKTVTANFSHIQHIISASAGSNGSISPSGNVSVLQSSNQTFTITASNNYHVAGVLVNGSPVGAVTTYTFTDVQGPHSIEASFAIDQYQVIFDLGTRGTLASGSLTQTVDYAASAAAPNVNANTGYTFDGWDSSAYTSVTSNMTITALYSINQYNFTVESAHGAPDPAVGTTTRDWGSTINAFIAQNEIVNGTTQYVATGWIGTGSLTNGFGTEASFTITNHSSITWQWQTNYWIELKVMGN